MSIGGPSFESGQSVSIILVLTAMPIFLYVVIGQVLASRGKMWIGFGINYILAIVFKKSRRINWFSESIFFCLYFYTFNNNMDL